MVTGICDPNKSRAQQHCSLKLGWKLKCLDLYCQFQHSQISLKFFFIIFLLKARNSLQNSFWIKTIDFVEKYLTRIFNLPFIENWTSILVSNKFYRDLFAVSMKIKSQLFLSSKILTKKKRNIFVSHPRVEHFLNNKPGLISKCRHHQ